MGIMLLSLKRSSLAVGIVALLLVVCGLVNPGVAHATTYSFGYTRDSGQHGEGIGLGVDSSSPCPSGYVNDVEAWLKDSQQNTWKTKIATTDVNGVWKSGVMIIDKNASIGMASITIACKNSLGYSFPYMELPWFYVSAQSTAITMDRAQFDMTSTISSVSGQGCSPGERMAFAIYGTEKNNVDIGLTAVLTGGAWSDSNGDWSVQIPVNNAVFDANKKYFIRAQCNWDSNMYFSYQFIPRWNKYVALGDSYSSGEGSFNPNLAGGACHRSSDSYPHYLANTENLDLPDLQACSGAVTDDFYVPNPNRPGEIAQLDPINDYTEVVTLTIGGNDIGFTDIAKECANYALRYGYGCSNSPVFDDAGARIAALAGIDTTPGDGQMIRTPENREIHPIKDILKDIAEAAAPNAKILIAGYPQLFGENYVYYDEEDGDAPGTYLCEVSSGFVGPTVKYSLGDAQTLNVLGRELNTVISEAVDAAVDELNDPNIVIEYQTPVFFNGHGLCDSGNPWVNGIVYDGVGQIMSDSLHPTVTGMQQGYGSVFSTNF